MLAIHCQLFLDAGKNALHLQGRIQSVTVGGHSQELDFRGGQYWSFHVKSFLKPLFSIGIFLKKGLTIAVYCSGSTCFVIWANEDGIQYTAYYHWESMNFIIHVMFQAHSLNSKQTEPVNDKDTSGFKNKRWSDWIHSQQISSSMMDPRTVRKRLHYKTMLFSGRAF